MKFLGASSCVTGDCGHPKKEEIIGEKGRAGNSFMTLCPRRRSVWGSRWTVVIVGHQEELSGCRGLNLSLEKISYTSYYAGSK